MELVEAIEEAQAAAEVDGVARIRQAMPGDWRAAARYLENVAPEWRRSKDGGGAETQPQPPAAPAGRTIL